MMYHHHIPARDQNETINKIYNKQKEETTKGDWYELLMKDFKFIEDDMIEEAIKSTTKQEFKNKIKKQVKEVAFKEFMKIKQNHSKLDGVHYTHLEIQPYLRSNQFSREERKLLFLLRSKCHSSKFNFRTKHKNNIKCTFQCNVVEDQRHVFTQCCRQQQLIKF